MREGESVIHKPPKYGKFVSARIENERIRVGAKVILKDYDILVFFFSILSYLEGNRKNIKTWTKVEKSSDDAKELSKTFDQNLVKTK